MILNMKKSLLVLGMITCVLGLTACGQKTEEAEENGLITEQQAIDYATNMITEIDNVVDNGQVDEVIAQSTEFDFTSVFTSWESAMEDMGDYNETTDYDITIGEDSVEIVATITGTNTLKNGKPRTGTVEFVLTNTADGLALSSITTTAEKTMGEMMTNAALNTLLGMGTVFVILILISLIITCFKFIPMIQDKLSSKKSKKDDKGQAVDNTIAQIIENEELSDDTELVAVIAAAIAASEGAASTDGFVVRSIKRANSKKWQNA